MKVILLSESSWRDCFRRTCFLTIFSSTATACFPHGYYQYGKFEVVTAKNYQYLRNCKKTTFLSRKFANTRSTKALRDYFALPESPPTSATLVYCMLTGLNQKSKKILITIKYSFKNATVTINSGYGET